MTLIQILTTIGVRRTERGATAVEYGLLIALIAAVILGTTILLGGTLQNAYTSIVDAFRDSR